MSSSNNNERDITSPLISSQQNDILPTGNTLNTLLLIDNTGLPPSSAGLNPSSSRKKTILN
jgi:hypothetical protein